MPFRSCPSAHARPLVCLRSCPWCSYSTVITAFANCNPALPGKAEEVLKAMLARGVNPDIITFNTIISAYANASPGQVL